MWAYVFYDPFLGAIHIWRQHPKGGGGVSEMLTKPDMGGGGVWPMMMSAKKDILLQSHKQDYSTFEFEFEIDFLRLIIVFIRYYFFCLYISFFKIL